MTTSEAPTDVAPVRAGEELDWARLKGYLASELPEVAGDLSVLQFPRGSANLTYRVQVGETRLVVRRPPFGSLAKGAHDMGREFRVLSRLHQVYDRAPRALLHCADPSVIGAEFVVSEYREGIVVWDQVPAALSAAPDASRRVGLAVIDALADLHQAAPAACGLEDLGRAEGYLGRQLAGWQRRWEAVADVSELSDAQRTKVDVERLGALLRSTEPASQRPGFVHNDYKIDNCQFRVADPDRVYSVFDWDMATIGDPLADFGTLLNYWPDSGLPADHPQAFIAASATRRLALPTRGEVIERYAAISDLDLEQIAWYEAFGCWKTSVILQQLYARLLRGESTDERMRQRGEMVGPLATRALDLLGA